MTELEERIRFIMARIVGERNRCALARDRVAVTMHDIRLNTLREALGEPQEWTKID
ncbi:hypothetical protein [Micromonospora coerulea]|uniref:hypothetical protein n=1 Tax=Micromonospora coerulea TaxID=47856 RepID=UPI0019044094|nr:hypothetical protein [Micromonospora veneta]